MKKLKAGFFVYPAVHLRASALNSTNNTPGGEPPTPDEPKNHFNRLDGFPLREIARVLAHSEPKALFKFKATCRQFRGVIDQKTECIAKVRNNGLAVKFASAELKNDSEVVLAAIGQTCFAIEHASDTLKNDPEVVLAAVKKYGFLLKFASNDMRNNPAVAIAAVSQDGWALEFAPDALKFASDELQRHPSIISAANSY
jgi:hypothetical protein